MPTTCGVQSTEALTLLTPCAAGTFNRRCLSRRCSGLEVWAAVCDEGCAACGRQQDMPVGISGRRAAPNPQCQW
eukprot:352159-Chlamydomonas_euryale.AAC.17